MTALRGIATAQLKLRAPSKPVLPELFSKPLSEGEASLPIQNATQVHLSVAVTNQIFCCRSFLGMRLARIFRGLPLWPPGPTLREQETLFGNLRSHLQQHQPELL